MAIQTLSNDQIIRISYGAARIYGRTSPDRSYGVDDFAQIAAIRLWKDNNRIEDIGNTLAFLIAKRAIFSEYKRIYRDKHKPNRGVRFGSPGELDDPEFTSLSVEEALIDKKTPWLNDYMVKDELETILIDETFDPREANVIESLLRGMSPRDIEEEFHISYDVVSRLIKNTIKRIRKRIGINDPTLLSGLEVFTDRLMTIRNGPITKDEMNMEGDSMLKGGLEGCGGLNIDIDSYMKAKAAAEDKKKAEIAAKRAEVIKNKKGKSVTRRDRFKQHMHRGGARPKMSGFVVIEPPSKIQSPRKQEDR